MALRNLASDLGIVHEDARPGLRHHRAPLATAGRADRERARLARAIALNSFGVLVAALFIGSGVLGFFGVSLEALRIAGGLSVAVSGWRMLSEDPEAA